MIRDVCVGCSQKLLNMVWVYNIVCIIKVDESDFIILA